MKHIYVNVNIGSWSTFDEQFKVKLNELISNVEITRLRSADTGVQTTVRGPTATRPGSRRSRPPSTCPSTSRAPGSRPTRPRTTRGSGPGRTRRSGTMKSPRLPGWFSLSHNLSQSRSFPRLYQLLNI